MSNRLNISSETRKTERNKAALEALSILKCWNDSNHDVCPAIDKKIMELASMMLIEDAAKENWRSKIAKKTDLIKWLILNIQFVMQGSEETRISTGELAGYMGSASCLTAATAAIGESFEDASGGIYSIVAQCRFDATDDHNGAKVYYNFYYGKQYLKKQEKCGVDFSNAALEYDDKRGYYESEYIRIRSHKTIPPTYRHWNLEAINHVAMRAKMAGKIVSGAKNFFKMQSASQAISEYATKTRS